MLKPPTRYYKRCTTSEKNKAHWPTQAELILISCHWYSMQKISILYFNLDVCGLILINGYEWEAVICDYFVSDFGITITIAIKNIIPLAVIKCRASQRLAEKYLNPNLNTKNPSFRRRLEPSRLHDTWRARRILMCHRKIEIWILAATKEC